MADLTTRPSAAVLNDADLFYLHQNGVSKKVNQETLRKLFSLEATPWDVTGALVAAYPTEFEGSSVVQVPSTNDFTFTMLPSASAFKMAFATGAVQLGTGQVWSKFVIPAHDPGDTYQGGGLVICNAGATLADLKASFSTFPTLVGTVDWLVYCIEVGGPTLAYYITKAGGIVGAIPFLMANPGDSVYFGVDFDAGTVMRQINAGPVDSLAIPLASFRVGFAVNSAPEPPVLLAGSILASLGTSDAGKTPMQTLGDAVAPVNVKDGKRYVVANSGTFAGKALSPGDLVEFYSNTSSIFVLPANIVSSAQLATEMSALLAQVDAKLVESYLASSYIRGCYNNWITHDEGAMYIVGPIPSGDFASFPAGSIAISIGGAWVNVASNLIGRSFSIRSAVGGQNGNVRGWITRLDEAGIIVDDYTPRFTIDDSYSYGDVGELGLLALGWAMAVRDKPALRSKRSANYVGQVSAPLSELGDCAVLELHIGNVSDIVVTFTHLANAYTDVVLVLINDGFGLTNVQVGGITVVTGPGVPVPVRVFGNNSFIKAQEM